MKYNPFRPHEMVAPGMFQGRHEEIDTIENSLNQTVHGNPTHFLVRGERGIGKSSLFLVAEAIASGKIPARDDTHFRFLVSSIDLGACNTQLDIVRAIGIGLKDAIGENDKIKKAGSTFYDWLQRWDVLGVRLHPLEPKDVEVQEAINDLVKELAAFCSSNSIRSLTDGILLLIDEADHPGDTADLGSTMKLLTERLKRKGCENVVIGLAGLPEVVDRLRRSHASSPRIFNSIPLATLSRDDAAAVVNAGLEDGNAKNGFETKINKDALSLLVRISEGYPHFIQQFSFSAFETDSDNKITVPDVLRGAFAKGGALFQLGERYFNEMYNLKIASDNYRSVLDVMADFGDTWVSRKELIEKSGLGEKIVDNALTALKGRNIIIPDESRRGFYRLPTQSFAAWINAIKQVTKKSGRPPEDVV